MGTPRTINRAARHADRLRHRTWSGLVSSRSPRPDSILGAALDEFAAHGFHDASLNRVIDAAGISRARCTPGC